MIFIIAILCATLFSYSEAQFFNDPLNVLIWNGLGNYYHHWAGNDANPFTNMPDEDRHGLCLAVAKAPHFVVRGNSGLDVRRGVVNTDATLRIQRTTVLIDGNPTERTVMLCDLEDGSKFYLGKSYDGPYLLFVTLHRDVSPELRAVVESAIKWLWLPGVWMYPHTDLDDLGKVNNSFCLMKDHEILNYCASAHRSRLVYDDNGSSYSLELESGSFNYCKPFTIQSFIESHLYKGDLEIQVATCLLTIHGNVDLFNTYGIFPDPTEFFQTMFVTTSIGVVGQVSITAKLQRLV